jgi:hypothetical protein
MNGMYNPNNIAMLRNEAMKIKNSLTMSPKEQVQALLNSGQMSQEWFNANFAYASELGKQLGQMK